MVNGTPDSSLMGWFGALWNTLLYLAAILAFCNLSLSAGSSSVGHRETALRIASIVLRVLGTAILLYLAFAFRGRDGHQIITLAPFSIHTEWYGILGLIGWAYLVGAIVFLLFRTQTTALLGCVVMLMSLYAADRSGAFQDFWLAKYVGIGGMLGAHPAITVAGLLLAAGVIAPPQATIWSRTRFTLLFVSGFSATALLLEGLYGINKNRATPSWCLWACAITAALWLVFYFIADVKRVPWISRSLAVAGQNVFLAYLLSDLFPSALELFGLENWYAGLATPHLLNAVARSAGCALIILAITAGLNRVGFRLRL